MKPVLWMISTLLLVIALPSEAGHKRYAKVIHVEPVYEVVERPHRHCRSSSRRTTTTTLVGAIAGGVIGHQFGDGNGKVLATIAGSGIGAAVGHQVGRSSHHCHGSGEWVESFKYYKVAYLYHGEIHHTRTKKHPGRRIKVKKHHSCRH